MHAGAIAPEVALQLLDRYFALKENFDHAQAHVDRATALLAVGRFNEAIESYYAALAREEEFTNLQTRTCLDLPYLIATRSIREEYDSALQLLQKHKNRLMFLLNPPHVHPSRKLTPMKIG
jgi:tetratricopeptide (TPR) repeat protein